MLCTLTNLTKKIMLFTPCPSIPWPGQVQGRCCNSYICNQDQTWIQSLTPSLHQTHYMPAMILTNLTLPVFNHPEQQIMASGTQPYSWAECCSRLSSMANWVQMPSSAPSPISAQKSLLSINAPLPEHIFNLSWQLCVSVNASTVLNTLSLRIHETSDKMMSEQQLFGQTKWGDWKRSIHQWQLD